MESHEALLSLLGGSLIGTAVTVMLLFNGRVTGISGILASSLEKPSPDGLWRWTLIAGLTLGGFIAQFFNPGLFINTSDRSPIVIIFAGLLVG
jgi:hypothetical protein